MALTPKLTERGEQELKRRQERHKAATSGINPGVTTGVTVTPTKTSGQKSANKSNLFNSGKYTIQETVEVEAPKSLQTSPVERLANARVSLSATAKPTVSSTQKLTTVSPALAEAQGKAQTQERMEALRSTPWESATKSTGNLLNSKPDLETAEERRFDAVVQGAQTDELESLRDKLADKAASVGSQPGVYDAVAKKGRAVNSELTGRKEEQFYTDLAAKRTELESVGKSADFSSVVEQTRKAIFRPGNALTGDADARNIVRDIQLLAREKSGEPTQDEPGEDAKYLTDTQRDTLLYYAGTDQWDKASEYLESIQRELNAAKVAAQKENVTAYAEEHPVMGAIGNVAASFITPAAWLGNVVQMAKNKITGTYEPVDTNANWFEGAHLSEATREGVSTAAEDMPVLGDIEVAGKNLGSFVAETGMSIGQFLSKVPLGPLALGYMGAGAAGEATYEALEGGATSEQAFLLGTASGLIEAATEKIGLDNLFGIVNKSGAAGVRAILSQMGSEASEEAISEVANNLVDLAVMGENSDLNQYIAALEQSGMSREKAEAQAVKQFFVTNVMWAAAGGALSGGAIGTGAVVPAMAEAKILDIKTGKAAQMSQFQYDAVRQGLQYDKSSESYKQASAISAKLDSSGGAVVSNADIGKLIRTMNAEKAKYGPKTQEGQAAAQQVIQDSIAEQAGKKAAKVITPAAQTYIDAGIDAVTADVAAGVALRVQAGDTSLTNSAIEKLELQNPVMREAFTAVIGIEVNEVKSNAEAMNEVRRIVGEQKKKAEAQTEFEQTVAREYLGVMQQVAASDKPVQETKPMAGLPKNEIINTEGTENGETKQWAANNGETLHLRDSGQRTASADSSGPVRAVEESAGRAHRGQSGGKPADSGAASFTYGAKVSTRALLGSSNGVDSKTLRVVIGGDTPATSAARRLAREQGLEPVLFSGGNLTLTDKNGEQYSARAYIKGTSPATTFFYAVQPPSATVYVRADHPRFTADQLMRHEVGHDMIAKGEIEPHLVQERVEKAVGREKLEQLSRMYAEAYEGSDLTPEEIWDEVICDSLGDMNIFAGENSEGAVSELLFEPEKSTEGDVELEPSEAQTEPDANVGVKTSRETKVPDNLTDKQQSDASAAQEAVRAAVREELGRMGKEYGWIKAGENPSRSVEIPKQTSDDKKVSQTVRTVMEAQATPDEVLPTIEGMVADGDFSYEVYGDEAAINDANEYITNRGWGDAQREWFKAMEKGEVSKRNTTVGWTLYNNAVNSGDTEAAIDILNAMVEHQRNAAQALQATRILKKMSPETQLYAVQKSVNRLQQELNDRYGSKKKGAPKITIDPELAEQLLNAPDQEARDEAMKEIYRSVGRQMPSKFADKWNAWRYLSMLGNLRTHGRNIAGNVFFAPVVATKNLTATAIESVVNRVSGGKAGRSKSLVTGLTKDDRALLSAAWNDYAGVEETVMGGGKYSDRASTNKYIEEGRVIYNKGVPTKLVEKVTGHTFEHGFLEKLRRSNSGALDTEDRWFSKPHYAAALASYCKANGITAEQIQKGEAVDEARAYAIKEAQKATYRDTNALSTAISQLGRYEGKNPVKKGVGIALEGILPFRKTPANILARGLEYSPAGIIKSLSYDIYKVRQGDMTGTELVDDLSAGLTGTGLLALGVFMAAQGLVRGHGGDEEEKEFEELMGHQAYSLEAGDTSITLDWLAPECLPFFVGVNLWEAADGGSEPATLADVFSAIGLVTEPLLEMSCLQSLNDVFDAVSYADSNGLDKLPAAVASAATSYLSQGLPTLLGQLERSSQDTRMDTYTEKNAFLTSDMQYTLGSASAKMPGVDYQQIPYIDAWGRTENTGGAGERVFNNMLNPAYVSTIEASEMEEELMRLYEETGDSSVFPSRADKYFTVNSKQLNLNAAQYVSYAKAKGQTAYDLLTELTGSEAYKGMNDTDKVEAVGLVYDYANALAKTKVSNYQLSGWVKKAEDAQKNAGVSVLEYILYKQAIAAVSTDGNTNTSQAEAEAALGLMSSLSEEQKAYLWQGTNSTWGKKNNPFK